MTVVYDASSEANKLLSDCKSKLSSLCDRLDLEVKPIIDIYVLEGSSRLFVRSINNLCDRVGIASRVHKLEWTIDSSSFKEELSEVITDTDGILFVRPPYSRDNYSKVSDIMKVIKSTVPERLDSDRVNYSISGNSYPPVVESVKRMIELYGDNSNLNNMSVLVVGNSNYVGKPMAAMVSDKFDQVVHLHMSTDSEIISRYARYSDVIITYRSVEDIDLNPNSFVIDVGDDNSSELLGGIVKGVTTHIGKLTSAILLSNVVDSFCVKVIGLSEPTC